LAVHIEQTRFQLHCLVLLDPAFRSDGGLPVGLAERVMASSVMDAVPKRLNSLQFREALIGLFPSYAARFAAADHWFAAPENPLEGPEMLVPVLILISTDAHPVLCAVSGPNAEVEWKRRIPQSVVMHIKSDHLTIPYTAETGWSILHFLVSVNGSIFNLDDLLTGHRRFAETDRVMNSARQSFRHVWSERYAGIDFSCNEVPHRDIDSNTTLLHVDTAKQRSIRFSLPTEHAYALEAQGYDNFALLMCLNQTSMTTVALNSVGLIEDGTFHLAKCLLEQLAIDLSKPSSSGN